jgi:hypothetical protein
MLDLDSIYADMFTDKLNIKNMKKAIWLFAFLCYGIIFSQEGDPIDVPKIVVKIPLGETVRLDDVAITFVKVIEDSRCPKNVTCIWQGRIIVQVAVKREGELIQNKELLLGKTKHGEQETTIIYSTENLLLNVVSVNPYPDIEDTGDRDYVLLVAVKR